MGDGPIAFLFPGQGSQYVGMGKKLWENFPVARQTFEEADQALGQALSNLCFYGPEEELALTVNCQPAILAVSVAAYRVILGKVGLEADVAAGHSLGEYSALICAGALDYADGLRLVRERGRFMQEAVPVGAGKMAAIMGLDRDVADEVCCQAAIAGTVAVANYNGGGQLVISGEARGVEEASLLATKAGAKRVIPLTVSAPFHSPLMGPAAERLEKVLGDISFRDPAFPVISNVDAQPNLLGERARLLLREQVCSPVRWEETMARLVEMGVTRAMEVGPGKVLSGLMRRGAPGIAISKMEDLIGWEG